MQKTKSEFVSVFTIYRNKEEMPNDWNLRRFGDFAKQLTRRFNEKNNAPILSVTKNRGFVKSLEYFKKQIYSQNISNYKLVCKGDFAYATIHLDEGSLGRMTVYESGYISPMYTVFVLDESVNHDYLYYLLKSEKYLQKYSLMGEGTVDRRKTISFQTLSKLFIPLPEIEEQQKIVSILSNVDNLIDSYDKTIQTTKKLKKGLMQKLLTRGIGHKKFKKVKELFGKEVEIPEEWESGIVECLTILDEKGSIRMGPFGSSLKTHELLNSGKIKTLWIENIVNNEFTWNYQKFISEKKYEELKGFTVKPNDILITMMGTLGRVAIVPENIGTAIISSHLLKISLDPKKSNPSFLFYVLKSHFILRQIIKESRGLVMGGLNTGIIKKLKIQIPPLSEQQKIVSILSSIDDKISKLESKKKSAESLKKGLMQKLLTGQIRVNV